MAQPVVIKVQVLEKRVTSLEELPPRMSGLELQIVQLRTEMHAEFSAVRGEIRSVDTGLREEIRSVDTGLCEEIRSVDTGLCEEIRSVETGLREEIRSVETSLHEEIRSVGTDLRQAIGEAQVQTRVLFEDFVARLAVVDEGKNVTSRRRKPKR